MPPVRPQSPQQMTPTPSSAIPKGFVVGALVALVLIGTCTTAKYIEPGEVGVVIHKTGGGVDSTPLLPGLHFRDPFTTSIVAYPTKMETMILAKSAKEGGEENEEINVNSQEGQPLSIDVSLSTVIDPKQAPVIYQTFKSDFGTIQHGFVKQAIRQAVQEVVGSEPIADVMGVKKAEVTNRARDRIVSALKKYVDVQQFTINEMRPPKAIEDAIAAKNVMQQTALTAQNELQKTTFEAQRDSIQAAGQAKAIINVARAQADAAELIAKAGSNEAYLKVKTIENQAAAIAKWNGELPTQMFGGAPVPFLNVAPSGTVKNP